MSKLFKFLFLGLISFVMAGCSITQKVEPVADGTTIDKIWIEDNPTAKHDVFDEEMAISVKKLGFEAEVYPKNKQPENSPFTLKYYVRWQWDLALYLKEFRGTLYKDNQEVGSMLYDATAGGGNMNKFGSTMSKVNPLIEELLQNAKAGSPVSSVERSSEGMDTVKQRMMRLKALYTEELITESEYSDQKKVLLEQL